MKRYSILIAIALFLSGCAGNTSQPGPISDADKMATIVAGTLSAMTLQAPTEILATQTSPESDSLTINGQLQGKLAFIRNNNLWISINGVESQLTNDAIGRPELWYSNPRISPDGTKIAYLKTLGFDTINLIVSDINGGNARQLPNVTWMEWSSDSQNIYYPVSNGFDMTTGIEPFFVRSINLATGEIQEHGQYGIITGCGGGSSDPADAMSSYENLRTSTGGGYIFSSSPQNNYVIHALTCQNVGLGILDLFTQQDSILNDNITGATVSPDGTKIAAVSNNNIIIFNASDRSIVSTLPTLETPRALLWAADSKEILYSTSRLADTLISDEGNEFKMNVSTLWQISLENGQNTKIIDIEAHDLKPIFTNGKKVLVVMVENAKELFDYISEGDQENTNDHLPTSNIIEVDLSTLSSSIILNDAQQSSYFK